MALNHRSVFAPGRRPGGGMELTPTPEQRSFRDEVRAWLRQNMPREWTARLAASSDVPRAEAYDLLRDWQRRLHAAGFIGLTWPREYGGRGLTFMEEMILAEEMALAKAPPVLNILGIGMAGPTIIAYGTEGQKKRYLPKILSADEIWCQGYSEPNAGSDLASLQTRAVRDGREYVVDGEEVWTALGFGHQMQLRIAPDGLIGTARRAEKPGHAVTKDPVLRQKIAQLWIDTECLKYTGARAITRLLKGEMPGPEASTGKMGWVETP